MPKKVTPFNPPPNSKQQRFFNRHFAPQMMEIEHFQHHLDQRLKYTLTGTKAADKILAHQCMQLHSSLLRLHHSCNMALSGKASEQDITRLLNEKDLYFLLDENNAPPEDIIKH